MNKDAVILEKIYPEISAKLKNNTPKLKQCIGRFIDKRSKDLYDTCPCSRIFFGIEDVQDFFRTMNISVSKVKSAISETYYGEISAFNPRAAKDEFVVCVLSCIRYYYLERKKSKQMEEMLRLSCIYLAFSGSMYPSIHYGSFPVVEPSEYRHVMEYAVNNMMTNKYVIKSEGSVIGAIEATINTWLETYDDRLTDFEDEDVVYLIQQLHDRKKSVMKNTAELYYEAYKDKDKYLTYDSDNYGDEEYRLADNDSLKVERIIENSINNINSSSTNIKRCKISANSLVRVDEVKNIVDSILMDRNNVPLIRDLIRCIVTDYYANNKNGDVRDVGFITYSVASKPNSKNPLILKQKEIIETFLSTSSNYQRRKSRDATRNAYYSSILKYFVYTIHDANR